MEQLDPKGIELIQAWQQDWNKFAYDALGARLDPDQRKILEAVQTSSMVSVASGTSRGKDFVAAVSALSFMYLTPRWDERGQMISNTKVACTAPTDRQVGNIMYPEITRLFNKAKFNGVYLPGRLTGYDIRTDFEEWFLTGFKADEHTEEAWTGFHAVNTMFVVTEASGMPDKVFTAIEGNLQGNSRLLLVFNPNVLTGYAARSQSSTRFTKFRLSSLTAPNVVKKVTEIPGQVDYTWVKDKVESWCVRISQGEFIEDEGDFEFEGNYYRPNDWFRVKVLGLFPKVDGDVLVPAGWVIRANERWSQIQRDQQAKAYMEKRSLRLGVDVAGMGRDSSSFCYRFGDYVDRFKLIQSGGVANHMAIAGWVKFETDKNTSQMKGLYPSSFIDTIGEGAGVYSRCLEQSVPRVHSVKAGAKAEDKSGNKLKDHNKVYTFKNLRAYLAWSVRDWLDPKNGFEPALPPDDDLFEELTQMKWNMRSDGVIEIEPKEDLKKRLKGQRSPDKFDSLAASFFPEPDVDSRTVESRRNLTNYFY